MQPPIFRDVLEARRRVRPYLARTPLHSYPALNALLGAEVYLKHENYQPVGAFKIRGGINLVSRMDAAERARGIVTSSTGNHGQSVAYAARLFGVTARIVVPVGANPGKVAAMRGMGAEVIFHGAQIDAARQHCEALAEAHGYRYIHSGNEPYLIAGVATETLEMLEDEPGLAALFVPVGGGSGAAGACIAAKAVNPAIRVVGVQSAASPAAYECWRQRKMVEAPNATIAEGLATGTGFALPQQILWEMLDDFLLVSDAEILQAMGWLVERAHTLAEGAGAAALAGAYKARADLAGKKVGVVVSGGNVTPAQLRQALETLEG
ncbi:MAG: threonine ammonia-lyase [Chloroflexota bacterium]